MEFELVQKDYKTERYESEQIWKGKKVTAVISMWYHTFLKYWDVGYYFVYNDDYITNYIKTEERKDRRTNRKIMMEWMKESKIDDIDNYVTEFYQKLILEE